MCLNDERKHLLADLEAIAASIRDPEKRKEVLKIIARLSPESDEWPDGAELMRIRLKCSGSSN
jgi:hypothetical protein